MKENKGLSDIGLFLNLGWIIALSLGLFTYAGINLDRKLASAPIFLLLGVLLGFATSGYAVYSAIKKSEQKSKKI